MCAEVHVPRLHFLTPSPLPYLPTYFRIYFFIKTFVLLDVLLGRNFGAAFSTKIMWAVEELARV